ncbi:MAG: hypothetical protein ABIQ18_12030 [Umezawaea sp.]
MNRLSAHRSSSMLGSFVLWLQDSVVQVGLIGIIEGVLGILAFAGLLSALLGSVAIKAAALVLAGLGTLGLFIVLVADRAEGHHRSRLESRLIHRYCRDVTRRIGHAWSVVEWDAITVIGANGDSRQTINCTAVVECEWLDFFSFWDGPNWDGWPERLRRKVKIDVRGPVVGQEGGTRPDVTWSWFSRNRVEVIAHFREAVKQGEVIGITAVLHWPSRCRPLVRGECAEDFIVSFPTALGLIRQTIVLPSNCEVFHEAVGLDRANGDGYTLTSRVNSSGHCETVLEVRDIEGGRRVGLRLDLK